MDKPQSKPIKDKEEILKNPDKKIDEDFKGFPGGLASEQIIKPETAEEEKTADLENKDGEKKVIKAGERKSFDKEDIGGSDNAVDDK